MSVRRRFSNLLALIRRRRLELELDSEILAHLELAEKDAVARGLSPEEARRESRVRFGGIAQMKEEHRDRRGIPLLETLFRDFRYGLASLRRAPGFSSVIIGLLALGIGGAVAMFSVVDSVLLKPLPFPEPDRIVCVWEAPRPGVVNATAVPQFLAWKRSANVFDAFAAEEPMSAALNEKSGPTRLSGKLVTAEYFKVFGTGAALGRTFTAAEDQSEATPVIVLSHAAWKTYFGGDPGILRRRVFLDGEGYQVIGVLQPGAFDRDQTQFWTPLIFTPAQKLSDTHWLTIYGRLRAGVGLTEARERMQAIYAALVETEPIADRGGSIAIEPLARLLVSGDLQRSISVAFGAVLLVLLIACANVANLLFAQGATRRAELAVRAALGAGRVRLIVQLLIESLVLCLFGGAAGVVVADVLIRLAIPLLSPSLPFTAEPVLDFRALGFGIAVATGVLLLAGVLPAFGTASGNLVDWLKQSARGSSGAPVRVRRSIVIGELAVSLVLVCGALLLMRSLVKFQQVDNGVRIESIVTGSLDLGANAYPTPQKAALFCQALTARLQSIPGVKSAGLSTYLPLEWISNGEAIQIGGAENLVRVRFKRVNSGYFGTLDIPVLAGRGITDRDREGTIPVAVINQELASRLAEAGLKNPIGKMVRLSSTDYQNNPRMLEVEIVGMIRSERTASPGEPAPAVVYIPLAQSPNPHLKLLVRTPQSGLGIVPAIRKAVSEIDPNLPLGSVATMQQVLDNTLLPASRPAWIIGVFAGIAVLLATIGLYGLISHSVTLQWHEIGIRMALGAPPNDVLSQVLRNALATVSLGIFLGLIGAFALTRVMKSLLFEVSPLDPFALVAACLCMLAIGLLAGFLPANRAARADPAATLRDTG